MSAEVLRRAAALMRERAEAAIPSPWINGEACVWHHSARHFFTVVSDGQAGDGGCSTEENAEHIASWHPAVALAVADWLEGVAVEMERRPIKHTQRAFAVARAYLGETA